MGMRTVEIRWLKDFGQAYKKGDRSSVPLDVAVLREREGFVKILTGIERPTQSGLKEAAFKYHKQGWNVLPVKYDKRPLVTSWKQWIAERQSLEEVLALDWDDRAFGVAGITGAGGFCAIDVDKGQVERSKGFFERFPITRIHKTPRGGYHYIFKSKNPPASTDKWKSQFGIELQGIGNYIILPPSFGGAYRVEDESVPIVEVEDFYNLVEDRAKALGWKEPERAREVNLANIEIENVFSLPCVYFFSKYQFPEGRRHLVWGKNLAVLLLKIYPDDSGKRYTIAKKLCEKQTDFSPVEILGYESWVLSGHTRFSCGEIINYLKEFAPKEKLECDKCPLGGATRSKKKKRANAVACAHLPDGRYAEEILRGGKEQFAVYDPTSGHVEFTDNLEIGGENLVPLPVREELGRALTLSDGVEEYESLANLRKEMLKFALKEFDPGENADLYTLCVYLFLTSWIAAEWLEPAAERYIPIVCARGPSETGKKRLLTVARFLCYRPLYAMKTYRVPSLFRAIAPWRGTLVLDEADIPESGLTGEFVQFLNSRADGVPITRYDSDRARQKWFYSFGMTVLATRKSFTDDGLESRLVVFPSEGTDRPEAYSLVPPKEFVEQGMKLQRKLLLFRLRHLKGEVPSQLIVSGVSSFRIREALLLLQALAKEDPELVRDIEKLAGKLETRLIAERAGSPEGLILNVVYSTLEDPETELQPWRDGYQILRSVQPRGVSRLSRVARLIICLKRENRS